MIARLQVAMAVLLIGSTSRVTAEQSLADLAREERAKKTGSDTARNGGRVYTNDIVQISTSSTASKSLSAAQRFENQLQLAKAMDILSIEDEKLQKLESQRGELAAQWRRANNSSNPADFKLSMTLEEQMRGLAPSIQEQKSVVEVAKRRLADLQQETQTSAASGRDTSELNGESSVIESMTRNELGDHYLAELNGVGFPDRADWEQRLSEKKDAFVKASQHAVTALDTYDASGAKPLVDSSLRLGIRAQEIVSAANRASQEQIRTWNELQLVVIEGRRRAALWKVQR